MNRRGFLSALALAPVAAVVAPSVIARPAYATGGMVSGIAGKWGIVGEIGPETIMPLKPINTAVRCWPDLGVPYEVALKGYDQALEDGDINEIGELTAKAEDLDHDPL